MTRAPATGRTPAVLGVDAGQSGSRIAVWRDERDWVVDGPAFGYLRDADQLAGALQSLEAALEAPAPGGGTVGDRLRGGDAPVRAACLGLTGPASHPDMAPAVADRLLARAPALEVAVVAGDHATSYAGALGLRPGVVIAAGTGVTACAASDQVAARLDGWGFLMGDRGGGFWIAQRALRAAASDADGCAVAPGLRAAVEEWFGPLAELPASLHRDPRMVRRVAAFAREVAARAAHDADAAAICRDAGLELAATASAAARRVALAETPIPVVLTGSVAGAGPPLTDAFARAVTADLPQAEVLPAAGSALDGARTLARVALDGRVPLLEGQLFVRRRGSTPPEAAAAPPPGDAAEHGAETIDDGLAGGPR